MSNIIKTVVKIGVATVAVCASQVFASDAAKESAMDLLQRGLAQGNTAVITASVTSDYIQHNPMAADGREGLIQFAAYLKSEQIPVAVNTVRVLREGNMVVLHSEYSMNGNKAIFDLFRVENGQFVEHWDGIQDIPETTVSGRSMLDGPTTIVDRDKTQKNKALVSNFVNDILVNGKGEKLSMYIGSTYLQHNPNIGDGLEGLGQFLSYLGENKISFAYNKVHNVVAEGNFVFTQSEGDFGGQATAFYDLFRVENGMIVEHWDTVQKIPAKMAHNNGMF